MANVAVIFANWQTVYWNAWGGDQKINDYISWVGEQVWDQYGVTVRHTKLTDTAEAVSRVVAEKSAGRLEGGSVDLIWINGENFASMKRNDLLLPAWTQNLPNYRFVDTEGKPTTVTDFTVPVDNLEAPWGMAQVVFMYDTETVPTPPKSIPALLEWSKENPGRFSYPQPPDFLGSTFLKQSLIALVEDTSALQVPATDSNFDAVTAPLWPYLDALNPTLWRSGRLFPQNGPAQIQLMNDGEIDIAISFSPGEASAAIAQDKLPDSVRTFVLDGGTIGNTHFVAIPFNANAKAGSQVVANFLMSPQAQARKQDPTYWGDGTVLDLAKLTPQEQGLFEGLPRGVATLSPIELGSALLEPHPSWMERIEAAWEKRYGGGK
ncbi:MAG: ABC transporter substrate-binding protein [Pseudomonadota bacterium]